MADLSPLGFIPAEIEDLGDGFKVVPPGIYDVVIVESDVNPTRSGGKMLELKYQIVSGPNAGDFLTDRLNIDNASDTAKRIGLSQLKNICDAIGFAGMLKDSNQLHGKPFSVKVVAEKFESNKEAGKMLESNKIEKRMKKGAMAAAAAPAPTTEQPRAAAAW